MPQKRRSRKSKKKNNSSIKKTLQLIVFAIFVIIGIFYAIDFATSSSNSENAAEEELLTSDHNINVNSAKLLEVKAPEELSEQFIEYKGFNVSFNTQYRIPNYVVYELTLQESKGDESRAKSFAKDETVDRCPEPYEYTRSGYDRGHMAPAADMKWDYDAMHNSFYMTNICPQKHSLNSGGWKRLEEKIRDWVVKDSALIIVTGPIITENMETIGDGIAVPTKFFKAILAPFSNPQKAIGFIYKNEGGQKKIKDQAVSIDEIEQQTGLDLFFNLPDDIENKLEKSCNFQQWNY